MRNGTRPGTPGFAPVPPHHGGGHGPGFELVSPAPGHGVVTDPPTPRDPPRNPPGGGGSTPPMTGSQQSAFDMMTQLLESYGLSSLAPMIQQMILDGTTDAASLQLALQGTNEWKQRFAGNEMLRQQGLGVLSPAEYLAVERSYAQVMKNYGLPSGFYDDPSDFAKFIGNNVSASELQQRVSMYSDIANREDPQVLAQLKSMGLSQGDLLAYTMDPTRAAPLIQRQYQTTLLGAAARRSGYTADNSYLGQLAARGVTEDQAQQGYGMIAGSLADANRLADVYGSDYGANDMQAEIFDNSGAAAKKRKRLSSQERAAFSGSAGVGPLTRDSSGSY